MLTTSNTALSQPHTNTLSWSLQDAAKQLSVGLSVLKRICRSMGLARWPYRSRNSLRGLIQKTEHYLVGLHVRHWLLRIEVRHGKGLLYGCMCVTVCRGVKAKF